MQHFTHRFNKSLFRENIYVNKIIMERANLWKMIVALLTMTMTVSLASCSDDDNEVVTKSDNSLAVDSVKTYCSIKLADTYYQFFDITVSYTTANGERISDVTLTKDTVITTACNGTSNYATNATCTVNITPKANQPELETETVYDMSKSFALYHYIYTNGNSYPASCKGGSSSSTKNASGSSLGNYMSTARTLYELETSQNTGTTEE